MAEEYTTRPDYYPFPSDIDERLRAGSLAHVYAAMAYPVGAPPVPLDVTLIGLTFDETRVPFIECDIVAALPEDQDVLDLLDPRKNCRVQVSLGYDDGGTRDVFMVADLHLRTRAVVRPNNTIQFSAWSDEGRAIDRKAMATTPQPPRTGVTEVLAYASALATYPEPAEVVSQFPSGYQAGMLTELSLEPGQPIWELLQDVAQRTQTWIRCDGDRRWKVTERATVAGTSAHMLMVGPTGSIKGATTALQRDDYFNAVSLRYQWKDSAGVERTIYGEAYVPGAGAHGVDAIGWNVHTEDRTGPITQQQANAAAQTALSYTITRGRGMQITAVAAYWLRPGMTVTVQLPTGGQERHLVRAVTFTPSEGTMSVTTRQPEDLNSNVGG